MGGRWMVAMKLTLGLLAYGALCYWQWVRLYSERKRSEVRVAAWALREGLVRVLEEDEQHVIYTLESVSSIHQPATRGHFWRLVRSTQHLRGQGMECPKPNAARAFLFLFLIYGICSSFGFYWSARTYLPGKGKGWSLA